MHIINPLQDHRWNQLVQQHPAATLFHSVEWLEALKRTYRYEPMVFSWAGPSLELTGGLLVCSVKSWLTGHRLVSLPFSDHCEPLTAGAEELSQTISFLRREVFQGRYNYIELRPLCEPPGLPAVMQQSESFCLHRLDIEKDCDKLFAQFHKSCTQRKIRRAERERLEYAASNSTDNLRAFYKLQIITRTRHGLPPQPLSWFRNLADCMKDKLNVHVVTKDSRPVASVLTMKFRQTLVCKYICSDKAYSNLGPLQFLFWKMIQRAKQEGLAELDLGRTDINNPGLIKFKDRLGADRTPLRYWRYSEAPIVQGQDTWKIELAKQVFSRIPNAWSLAAGALLYKHVG